MDNSTKTTKKSGTSNLDGSLIEEFQTKIRGRLLQPGAAGYDEARTIHNGMIDHRPKLIVQCAGVADVINAVHFARDNRLLLSVHGGGHSVPGFSVCEDGLMIDMSPMKGVRVDPIARTVKAQSGLTWAELDHETQAFGLATTGGLARPTGIAGLTLAGGHGILMRKYGLACDNLLSVDVITAGGQLVTASVTQNEDLFWGIRGGGGNFGIVTSFEYQLHPVDLLLGGLLIYPFDEAREVLKFYHEFSRTAPDELGLLAILGTLPDGNKAVIILLGYNGTIAQGEHVLRPLRDFGTPLKDEIGAMPYCVFQSIVENFNPAGLRNYWKTSYLKDLGEDAITQLCEFYETVPAPFTHLILYTLGGAVANVGDNDTAVSFRDAAHALLLVGMWDGADNDENVIGWIRNLWEAMQPFSSQGFYINYEATVAKERMKEAYGPEKYERLVALKNKYDPENIFRLNQNIKPTV